MSDIFLSYASTDRPRAQMLAAALQQSGWSVWWDRQIQPGKTFDQVIEEHLSAARCVVVLWSLDSISSRWVKTEASEGADRSILVPALIDNITIPLEFRRIQAAQLTDWHGKEHDPEFSKLVQAIEGVIGQPGSAVNIKSQPLLKESEAAPSFVFPRWLIALLVVLGGMSVLTVINAVGVDVVRNELGGGADGALMFVVLIWLVGGPLVLYVAWKLWHGK